MRNLSIHDDPGHPPRHTHQGDGTSGAGSGSHVHPRIQALERRMQQRSPERRRQGGGSGGNLMTTPLSISSATHLPNTSKEDDSASTVLMTMSSNYPTATTTATTTFEHRNKENNNHHHSALVLHSPILSSIYNSNIKQFEADVLKRQAEYTNRISDLEGRLAMFHSRLAVECAERGREFAFTMEEYVDGPLEQAMRRSLERITTDFVVPIMDPKYATNSLHDDNGLHRELPSSAVENKDCGEDIVLGEIHDESHDANNANATVDTTTPAETTTPTTLPNLVSVERCTNHLESQMNHYKHITLVQARRQSFDNIDKTCRHTLHPALVLEMTKANKREGGVVRRFESNAGEYTRLVAEMTASRASSLGYIKNEVDDWEAIDSTFAEHYLEEIQFLKQRVMETRDERMRQDEMVVEKMIQVKKALEEDIFSVCS